MLGPSVTKKDVLLLDMCWGCVGVVLERRVDISFHQESPMVDDANELSFVSAAKEVSIDDETVKGSEEESVAFAFLMLKHCLMGVVTSEICAPPCVCSRDKVSHHFQADLVEG